MDGKQEEISLWIRKKTGYFLKQLRNEKRS